MSLSVLVVDDDVSFRELASRLLRGWGHRVIGEAGTVGEALAQAEQLRPQAVLADISLPDGDGFELTQALLAMPWPTRVVLISADSGAGYGPAAHRAGAVGFLSKVDLSDLAFRTLLEAS